MRDIEEHAYEIEEDDLLSVCRQRDGSVWPSAGKHDIGGFTIRHPCRTAAECERAASWHEEAAREIRETKRLIEERERKVGRLREAERKAALEAAEARP